MTKHQVFGLLGLVFAMLSPFISGPFLLIAVLCLAVAVLLIGL